MGLLSLAVATVAGSLAAFCAAASTPPTTNESSVKTERPRLGRIDGQRPNQYWRDRAAATTKPSADELSEVDDFMKENSPKRWGKIQDMPDKRKDNIMQFVVQRYRMLQDLKRNDEDMYNLRVKRLKIEDEIFDLGWDLKNSKNGDQNNAQLESTRKELRKTVRALVDNRIEEHRLRLKQWQEKMDEERKRMVAEQNSEDQFVDSSVKAIENDMRWPGMGDFVMPLPGGRTAPPGRELRNMAPAAPATQPNSSSSSSNDAR
jgi:hypothetical protein